MITPEGTKTIGANGIESYTYRCKYDTQCDKQNRYNPAITLHNKHGAEYLNKCTHGGGSHCHIWRNKTDIEIGWKQPYNRHQKRKWETTQQ